MSEQFANTFIIKTYHHTRSAEKYYRNEIEAFRKLNPNRESIPFIIEYYGSFIKGEKSFNIILEFADQGTLENYFQNQQPPTTGVDIHNFWKGLFQLIRALMTIHEVPPLRPGQDGLPILRG